jgi:CheY-like chemotaxis protein
MPIKRILVVDDARDIGRMYQQALQDAYPRVTITYVPSAEEAIVETITYMVDLLVVDIRLPGMSGFDLVRRVRSRHPDLKVMMITGMALDDALKRQSQEVGAACLLRKPLSVPDFLEAVRMTLTGENAPLPQPVMGTRKGKARSSAMARPGAAGAVRNVAPGGEAELVRTLDELRGSLGGLAAWLVDDARRMTAQVGNWPGGELARLLIPDVLSGVSAAQKVSRQMGVAIPEAVQALRGPEYDLLAAPVGRYVLLVFLKKDSGSLRLALGFEAALQAQKKLGEVLYAMGLNIHPVLLPPSEEESKVEEEGELAESAAPAEAPLQAPPAIPMASPPARPAPASAPETPEAEEESPAKLRALEALLDGSPAAQDADAFWDNLNAGETPAPSDSDVLTYEQAVKLGLIPREDKPSPG